MTDIPGGVEPGRGKTPSERHVDVPAAPLPDVFTWPPRNSEQIEFAEPVRPIGKIEIDATPIEDVTEMLDRVTGIPRARRDPGIIQP
jgi:hypothetical protein